MVPAIRTSLAAALTVLLAAGAASAQSGPSLPTMPLPPSAADPAPKEAAAARKARPAPARKRAEADDPSSPAEGSRKAAPRKSNAASVDRPSRYVPEEFDRDGTAEGGRARPFMSESGRPGMGMRF